MDCTNWTRDAIPPLTFASLYANPTPTRFSVRMLSCVLFAACSLWCLSYSIKQQYTWCVLRSGFFFCQSVWGCSCFCPHLWSHMYHFRHCPHGCSDLIHQCLWGCSDHIRHPQSCLAVGGISLWYVSYCNTPLVFSLTFVACLSSGCLSWWLVSGDTPAIEGGRGIHLNYSPGSRLVESKQSSVLWTPCNHCLIYEDCHTVCLYSLPFAHNNLPSRRRCFLSLEKYSCSILFHVRITRGIAKLGIFLKFCFVPNLARGKDAQCSVMVTLNRMERHLSAHSLSSVVGSFLPKTITRLYRSFNHSHNDSLNDGLSPYRWNICTKSNATQCWTISLKKSGCPLLG